MKLSAKTVGWLLPLIVFTIIMVMWSVKTPMVTDEYAFYRLSKDFPDLHGTANWFLKDRPSILTNSINWDKQTQEDAFRSIYDAQVYPHVPLMTMAFAPLTKGLNWLADKGVLPHLEDEAGFAAPQDVQRAEVITIILRMFSIATFLLSMYLIYRMLYNKIGKNALFFAVPLAASYQLLMGAYLFYWDVFMMFFMVLTFYLMEKKSKWAYLTACLMVNTKMFVALVFLIPFAVKNWKMILMGFSILPWFAVSYFITGQPFYFFTHYLGVVGEHNYMAQLYNFGQWISILIALGMPFFVIMTFPIFRWIKKYPEYVALLLITLLYAYNGGLALTHMSSLLYAGCLIFPIVAYEFKLSDRLNRLMNKKQTA